MDGIVLLDKPAGLSSNQALQQVRRLFEARKAGHAGSLDPFATGMLPVCLGEATKFTGVLLGAAKGYLAGCQLGMSTTTGDPEGEVLDSAPLPDLSRRRIDSVLAGFVGEIEQIPPMYSALKHQGKRLYQLAREGREVERSPRRVRIYELELLGVNRAHLELKVSCSKGTYIRTLVEDVARKLGTVGHTVALRRTWVGPFPEGTMRSLDELRSMSELGTLGRVVLNTDAALEELPAVHLDSAEARRVAHGQIVDTAQDQQGRVRLYRRGGEFLGVGEIRADGSLAPIRLISTERGAGAGSAGSDLPKTAGDE